MREVGRGEEMKHPGPHPKGYAKILVRLPVEYIAAMKAENEKCGGLYPVNEQIRQAVRGKLCGLVYTSLLKT